MFKLMGKKIFTLILYLNLWRDRGEEKERERGEGIERMRERGNVQLYNTVHSEI